MGYQGTALNTASDAFFVVSDCEGMRKKFFSFRFTPCLLIPCIADTARQQRRLATYGAGKGRAPYIVPVSMNPVEALHR